MGSSSPLRWQMILIVTMLVWASQYVALKYLLQHYQPETLVFYRVFFAAITLGVVFACFKRRAVTLGKKDIALILVVSMVGVLASGLLLMYGIQYAGATIAAILINTNPFFIALIAGALALERLYFRRILGIIVGLIGVTMILLRNGNIIELIAQAEFRGAVFALLAGLSIAIMTIIGKQVIPRLGGLAYTLFTFIPSIVVLGIICLFINPQLFGIHNWRDFLVFAYLGIVTTALVWWIFAESLKHLDASHTATYKLLIPLFAAILAFIFFQEKLNLVAYIGMAVVSLGIYFVSKAKTIKKSVETKNQVPDI